jgi:hypothetical protein
VGHPAAHVVLGEDHVVGADPLQDAAVGHGDRLGPDVRHLQGGQHRRAQDAGLQVGADTDHGPGELPRPQLPHDLLVGGVGLDGMGEVAGGALHVAGVSVDPQDLVAQLRERLGHRGPEPPEPDHQDPVVRSVPSQ